MSSIWAELYKLDLTVLGVIMNCTQLSSRRIQFMEDLRSVPHVLIRIHEDLHCNIRSKRKDAKTT